MSRHPPRDDADYPPPAVMSHTTRLYVVLIAVLHPVTARVGDRIVVRPGHPCRPVVVVRRAANNEWEPIAVGPPHLDAIVRMEAEGVISLVCEQGDASPLVRRALLA